MADYGYFYVDAWQAEDLENHNFLARTLPLALSEFFKPINVDWRWLSTLLQFGDGSLYFTSRPI